MKIEATEPLVKDGVEYPYYAVSMSMSPVWKPGLGCSVSIRLTPFRETQDGAIDKLVQHPVAVSIIDVFAENNGDEHLETAIAQIMSKLQDLVDNKKL